MDERQAEWHEADRCGSVGSQSDGPAKIHRDQVWRRKADGLPVKVLGEPENGTVHILYRDATRAITGKSLRQHYVLEGGE